MYIFQINEWREKDVIKCEEKKKLSVKEICSTIFMQFKFSTCQVY